jgi:TolA-binding protein
LLVGGGHGRLIRAGERKTGGRLYSRPGRWSEMGYALKIYEAFQDLGKEKAAILAEFVEYVESKKAATSGELRETELRLQAEIEEVRKETQQVRLEVEQVRKELKETELRLQKEIEGVRLEVERVKSGLVKWMFLFWTGQVAAMIGILRWLLH